MNELVKKALSNFDLYELFENKIRIITYNELRNYDSIEDVFGKFEVVFILYKTGDKIGHWVVICWDKARNTIIFFDPYGLFPDEQLDYTDDKYNTQFPYLSLLLSNFQGKIRYNSNKLQDIKNKDVKTCGRWCALFALLFKYLDVDEFGKIFLDSNVYPDNAITILTHYI